MLRFPMDLLDRSTRLPTIGVVVLQTDETLENDLRHYCPPSDTDVYITRVPSNLEVTRETLAEMSNSIEGAAALLPRSIPFDVVGYGCTSGTAVIGPDNIDTLIRAGRNTRHVTEPVSALLHTCRKHAIKRLAFLSPYIESVSEALRATLARAGIETPVFGSFEEAEEAKVARIDPACTRRAAIELARAGNIDGLFLSCTNLKTIDILADIQAETGIPTFSSNSVLAAHLNHLARLRPE